MRVGGWLKKIIIMSTWLLNDPIPNLFLIVYFIFSKGVLIGSFRSSWQKAVKDHDDAFKTKQVFSFIRYSGIGSQQLE